MESPPPRSDELLGRVIAGLHALFRPWHSSTSPRWSELPQELLGLVLAGLPHPADRARFRLVCRSWYSAPPPPQLSWIDSVCRSWYSVSSPKQQSSIQSVCRLLETPDSRSDVPWRCIWRSIFSPRKRPWIVIPGGFFLDDIALKFSECGPKPTASFPENLRCVGSTDNWLALDFMDNEKRHTYFLHNPFSKEIVPLSKLDAVIGNASELFHIHKVLMRSTPDDLVSVMTNNWNYPIILIQPKKGVWLPKPQTTPFVSIIDVAFLGDILYGITKDEELFSLRIIFDVHNTPMVTMERVIWSNIDGADAANDENNGEGGNNDEGEQDNNEVLSEDDTRLTWNTGDGKIDGGITYEHGFMIFRYLVESCGNLLMVRRQLNGVKLSYRVEVFIANMSARRWIPMSSGLGGQALFISKRFSKCSLKGSDLDREGSPAVPQALLTLGTALPPRGGTTATHHPDLAGPDADLGATSPEMRSRAGSCVHGERNTRRRRPQADSARRRLPTAAEGGGGRGGDAGGWVPRDEYDA
uniref:Uncharacterized protein n=1 Tax=Avena sativa TaxID=4498 RepID=A0ACD5ZSN8_AVESA